MQSIDMSDLRNEDRMAELFLMMRKVVKETSDESSEKMTANLRLEILKNNNQLKIEIVEEMDKRMQSSFGMTGMQHVIQHAKMTDILDTKRQLKQSIINKVGTVTLMLVLMTAFNAWTGKPVINTPYINSKYESLQEDKRVTPSGEKK